MGSLRAATITGLAVVALAGAAVAGVEQALTEPPQPSAAEAAAAADTGPTLTSRPPAPRAVIAADADLSPTPQPSASQAVAAADVDSPCLSLAIVCIQLSTESAWVQDGSGPVTVSVGRADSPTPVGLFRVEAKRIDHVSSLDGTPMPYAVFFAGDVALYEGDVTEPSAGSVRLPSGTGEEFFDAVDEGDAVQVMP